MLSAEPAVPAPLEHAMIGNLRRRPRSAGPPSLAAGIACTVSSDQATAALRKSGGRPLTFREDALVEAANELAHEGLWQEYSGAAGLAALREANQRGKGSKPPS